MILEHFSKMLHFFLNRYSCTTLSPKSYKYTRESFKLTTKHISIQDVFELDIHAVNFLIKNYLSDIRRDALCQFCSKR